MTMPNLFARGFENQDQELTIDALPITGNIPDWLTGTLVRNGPGRFEVGEQSYRHWFDGLAMLHSFTFHDGAVAYRNRFLRSDVYLRDTESGRVNYRGFAVDPCRTLFQRVMSFMIPASAPEPERHNAVVNVTKIADKYIAMTESPMALEFDPRTLDTREAFDFDGPIDAQTATAHPHYDFERQCGYNYMLKIGRESAYQIYALEGAKRRLVARIPVQQPAYMHSFALTERYVVITENALRLPGLKNVLSLALGNRPFIENFEWQPQSVTRFLIIDKDSGDLVRVAETEPVFIFHHVNAYEIQDDDNGPSIVLDASAYSDTRIIEGLYLDSLRGSKYPDHSGEFRRYTIPLRTPANGGGRVSYDVLSPEPIELPRINYRHYNGRDYTYAYGISLKEARKDFPNQLVKVNVKTTETRTWSAPKQYPGEPVFVSAPHATGEDEGVVLSVVLDAEVGTSYLLVLDAKTFAEIGRAYVPQHIPFGFHGDFYRDV